MLQWQCLNYTAVWLRDNLYVTNLSQICCNAYCVCLVCYILSLILWINTADHFTWWSHKISQGNNHLSWCCVPNYWLFKNHKSENRGSKLHRLLRVNPAKIRLQSVQKLSRASALNVITPLSVCGPWRLILLLCTVASYHMPDLHCHGYCNT